MNPLIDNVDTVATLDDLPKDPPALTQVYVNDHERHFIFDGFKWTAEGDKPDGYIHHWPPAESSEPSDFKHCPKCVGIQAITTIPPKVKYECFQCGGGVEDMEPIELPVGSAGPVKDSNDILAQAHTIIYGQRRQQYGDASESFGRIARLWSAYLSHELRPIDVANMMILLKVSRSRHHYQQDSYVDIAGYAALTEELTDDA